MGLETIFMLALSYGASALAASLQDKPKQKNFARDDKPTTLADRGSYIPLVIGRRSIGYIFGWAGNREVVPEVTGSTGGKGGGSSKKTYQQIYREDGWHVLCVGPALALHAIRQGGVKIFDETINSGSTPSGSIIDLGKEGAFQIFWGECDQAINTRLGAGIGINSQWPHICSVYWISKRLGPSARWDTIDYEIEVTPQVAGDPGIAQHYRVGSGGTAIKVSGDVTVSPLATLWSTDFTPGLGNQIYSQVITKDGSNDLIFSRRRSGSSVDNVFRMAFTDGAILWRTNTAGGDAPRGARLDPDTHEYYVHNHSSSLALIKTIDGTIQWENTGQFGYSGGEGCVILPIDAGFVPRGVVGVTSGTPRLVIADFLTGLPIDKVFNIPNDLITTINQWKEFVFNEDFVGSPSPQRPIIWAEGRQMIVPHQPADLEPGAPVQTTSGRANITSYDIDTGEVLWRADLFNTIAATDLALIDPGGTFPKLMVSYSAVTADTVLSLRAGEEGKAIGRQFPVNSSTVGQPGYDGDGQIWSGETGTPITTVSLADDPQQRVFAVEGFVTPQAFQVIPKSAVALGGGATSQLNEGIAPDVALKQLLTGTYPHGAAINPSLIDCVSIADMGAITTAEQLGVNILMADGISGSQAVADLMQDIGMMMHENGNALKFVTIREQLTAPLLTNDFLLPPEPEIEFEMGPKKSDRLVFVFKDRTKNYRDVDIQVDDDSSMGIHGRPKVKKASINNVTKFEIAANIANRRQQEELANLIGFRITLIRDGADLRPGQIFILEGIATMICMAVEINTQDRKALIDAVASYYADVVPDFIPGQGIGTAETLDVAPDNPFFALETPFSFNNGQDPNLALSVLRNRAHNEISGAEVFLSNNDITYDLSANQNSFAPGGTLDEDFDTTQDAPSGVIEDGPLFTTDDPSGITLVENFNSDLQAWRTGIQACLIVNLAAGTFEIFYLRSIEAVATNQFRLKGLIGGRGETQSKAHVTGDRVFIFRPDSIRQQIHPFLNLDEGVFIKTQPRTSAKVQTLSDVVSQEITIKGNAFRPLPLDNFFGNFVQRGPLDEWSVGADTTFRWDFRIKPGTGLGAGELGAGIPIGTDTPTPEGTFTLVITDLADVVKRTEIGLTSPTFLYTNVALVADFGGEPTSYKAKLTEVVGAYATDQLELTMTRV